MGAQIPTVLPSLGFCVTFIGSTSFVVCFSKYLIGKLFISAKSAPESIIIISVHLVCAVRLKFLLPENVPYVICFLGFSLLFDVCGRIIKLIWHCCQQLLKI